MRKYKNLKIDDPNSTREKEADRIAERVMSGRKMINRKPSGKENAGVMSQKDTIGLLGGMIQRKQDSVQRFEKTSSIDSSPLALSSEGQQLSESQREFFEPALGFDLGDVRIHSDNNSAKTAEELGARAFASGRDIVFGRGEFSPETYEGKKLLAHELAHVGQGSGERVLFRAVEDKKQKKAAEQLKVINKKQELWEKAHELTSSKGLPKEDDNSLLAKWILEAYEFGFCKEKFGMPIQDLTDIRDKSNVLPENAELKAVFTIYTLIKANITSWIADCEKEEKDSTADFDPLIYNEIQDKYNNGSSSFVDIFKIPTLATRKWAKYPEYKPFVIGSFMRWKNGVFRNGEKDAHKKGNSIDLNPEPVSVNSALKILKSLPKGKKYKLGLPMELGSSIEFFDMGEQIELLTPTENKPVEGIKDKSSKTYEKKIEDGKIIEQLKENQVYKKIKNETLRNYLMENTPSVFEIIFPDGTGHIHVETL